MRTEAQEQIDELPEDFTSAWATVLLDLWERRSQKAQEAADIRDNESETKSGHVKKDEPHAA